MKEARGAGRLPPTSSPSPEDHDVARRQATWLVPGTGASQLRDSAGITPASLTLLTPPATAGARRSWHTHARAAGIGWPHGRRAHPRSVTPRGRRPAGEDTRGAIAGAAREEFAERGYDGTSLRAVARRAGVDPALVHHYFDGKAALFAAAMDLPVSTDAIVAGILRGDPAGIGERLARAFLATWDDPANTPHIVAMLRAGTTHEAAGRMLREFLTAEVFGRVARAASPADDPSVPLRAGLAAAQMIGVALLRYAAPHPPLADAPADEVARRLGPVLQRYLAG